MQPQDPIAAVTHADPYPYYGELVARRPFYRDATLGMWVASGAEAVSAVLTSELCRVRSAAEPIPKALAGSPAGELFARWIRMNDGPAHVRMKRAVQATLSTRAAARAAEFSERWSRTLAQDLSGHSGGAVAEYPFRLPVYVLGSLLGIPDDALPGTAAAVRALAGALAPAADVNTVARGGYAAGELREEFLARQESVTPDAGANMLSLLAREAQSAGCGDSAAIAANGIAFMVQAYEATAGLIGNTLLALARRPELREQAATQPALLEAVMREVLRFDPPVQNTRRWLARAGTVAGHELAAGDMVLVVLAAANRDPAVNPDPSCFDPRRTAVRCFTFGLDEHACPGEVLALTIAGAGVARVLDIGLADELWAESVCYQPSANARIALLGLPPEPRIERAQL